MRRPCHHGQVDPTEAIERHARNIGFPNPSHLVRAWRSGYAILMLDGFDEIATAGWSERSKSLRELRYRSMELVRKFIRDTSSNNSIVLSGRLHFFNSERELRSALGTDGSFSAIVLNDFSEEQVTEYLKKRGWNDPIPGWLPTRPLLLGYLASRGLLQQVCEVEVGSSPAAGWNALLERICPREAEIEAGIDASTVRRVIERLATRARASSDGLGPISTEQIRSVFTEVCGYSPDERALVLLQRLPGLGVYRADDDSRSFIDNDLAQAAQAGDVFRYIENPFDDQEYARLDPGTWQCSLSPVGSEVLALRCHTATFGEGKLATAAVCAMDSKSGDTLCADVVLAIRGLNYNYLDKNLYINSVIIPKFSADGMTGTLDRITFQECLIQELEMDGDVKQDSLPRFHACYFARIEGRASASDLPKSVFEDCITEEFDNATTTTNSILQLEIPLGSKVLLTILRKLYIQRGTGRREAAFYRGLDHQAQRMVQHILDIVRKHGFAMRTKHGSDFVWLPVRSSQIMKRAHTIISAPNSTHDILLQESATLEQ